MTARIVFTIPEGMAEKMTQSSQPIYLDVFGAVRLNTTFEKVGDWMRIAPGPVTRYKAGE